MIPLVFVIMSLYTCGIFFKRRSVDSRALLGFCGVISVLLSLMTGYGLMFIIGVPMSSMTQILPFIIFGIGLDDAYILVGAYHRTDKADPVDLRIKHTIEDVGLSITLTTLTSTLAFTLGSTSSIPTIYWLCYYAIAAIDIIFIYQLTFFIACLVLDERRIAANRRDCCFCRQAREMETESKSGTEYIDMFMVSFSEFIIRPVAKICIVIAFLVLLAVSALSASKLKQEFEFTSVLPADSYVTDFQDAVDIHTDRGGIAPNVYFRYVNQSDPEIQRQMEEYIADLVTIDAIIVPPDFFWLWDFREFVDELEDGLSFTEQLDAFLEDPVYAEEYTDMIVRDGNGDILTSRCEIHMDELDLEDVNQQIDALEDQREVTRDQAINEGKDDWPFFTYDGIYQIWEFYAVSVDELVWTTVYGVLSVTAVAFLFIPHWSAAPIVLPFIGVLYVDLLGVMQWGGVHINPVSYIALVMSIGLLVDFIMHVLLRYYESPGTRVEKVQYTLKTMGSSILVGGIASFLGTLPLAFSTSEIFTTVFIGFIGLVALGASHGLILLPVILSTVGTEDQIGSRFHASLKAETAERSDEPATNGESSE